MATLLSDKDLTGIVAHSASLLIATCSPSLTVVSWYQEAHRHLHGGW